MRILPLTHRVQSVKLLEFVCHLRIYGKLSKLLVPVNVQKLLAVKITTLQTLFLDF